jgi:hypothetical protein
MPKMVTITLTLDDALDAAYACVMRSSCYAEQATASQPDSRRTFDILASKYDRIGKAMYVAINNAAPLAQLKEIA